MWKLVNIWDSTGNLLRTIKKEDYNSIWPLLKLYKLKSTF